MGLTKRSESKKIFLEVKYYCLWRSLQKPVDGCDVQEPTNPRTGKKVTQYGYGFDSVSGRAVQLEKYDTGTKYAQRYFGFKLHLQDGVDTFVITMPYQSQVLRRFLRLAPNVDWSKPLSLSVFKGKKNKGEAEDTGIWFQQGGETVRAYYTKDNPHDMPAAVYYEAEQKWDFRAQQQWLVQKLMAVTGPAIEAAAPKAAPPVEPHYEQDERVEDVPTNESGPPNDFGPEGITDDDIPF